MGLVSSLCSDMSVSPEVLARIVGLPVERVAHWGVGGVPPTHHSDFRPLEDLLEVVRHRSRLPLRGAIRVAIPALDGRSILDLLEKEGAVRVLERLLVAPTLDPLWAGGAAEAPEATRASRSVA